jgi:hypothetical protein
VTERFQEAKHIAEVLETANLGHHFQSLLLHQTIISPSASF